MMRRAARLTPTEEATALFAASEAGSRTAIREKTGLGKDNAKAAYQADALPLRCTGGLVHVTG